MTAKLRLGGLIVDSFVAKLKTGMTTRVGSVNSDYASVDEIVIDVPRTTGGGNPLDGSDYYTAYSQSIPHAPAIFVLEGPMVVDGTSEGPHSFESDTKILVLVLEEAPNTQILGKKLQRQVRAVFETAWDDAPKEALTAVAPFSGQQAAFRLHIESTRPGRAFEEGPDQYRQLYQLVFSARSLEPGQ